MLKEAEKKNESQEVDSKLLHMAKALLQCDS
jgi:hypothetical protein